MRTLGSPASRPQAGYEAPDDNWSLGAVQRVDPLLRNLGGGRNLTPARVVSAMNEAATQDVREVTLEPTSSKLLHGGRAPSNRAAQMLALLDGVVSPRSSPACCPTGCAIRTDRAASSR